MSEQRNTFTRQELYERVWTTPIVRLAEELGYSYPELITIIATLNIPRPSGGYWYRLQHGGASEQIPLPPAPEGAQTEIPFGPRLNAPLPADPPTYVGEPKAEPTPAPKKPRKIATEKASETGETQTVPFQAAASTMESAVKSAKPAVPARVAPTFPDVVHMSREELYQHVWTTPIHLLAEALGLSDVGLAKTCVQMEVPRPGRGYWARLDAGEPVEKIHLPPPSTEAIRNWTFNVALNRKRRADWAAANLSAPSKGKARPAITLPSEQEPLHEIADRHRVALEKAKPDEHGLVHLDMQTLFCCDVSVAMVPKLVRAIHALVVELEKHHCRLVRGDKELAHLSVAQGKDRLTVQWREHLEEFEREPSMEEKRKPNWTWQLKGKRATNRLTVEVSAIGLRGQRSWTESESKPIEHVLARVMEKIEASFEGFEAQRQREAEQERQRAENAKRYAETAAQREKEEKEKARIERHEEKMQEIAKVRRTNLGIAAQNWEDSERVLAFINALEKRWRNISGGELSAVQTRWLAWARDEAAKAAAWMGNYPDPESVRICDPATIPIGGPYPQMHELEPSAFSREESKPERPPYPQYYGYSKY